MQARWFSLVSGTVVGLGLLVGTAPDAFAQKGGGHSGGHSSGGHSSGGHSSGGHSSGGSGHQGGSWNGHNHGGFGVGVYLGGYGGYGGYPYYGYGYGSSYSVPYVYDAYPPVNYNTYQSFYVPPTGGDPGPGPSPDAAGPVVNVAINDGSFSPAQLAVKVGTTVRFTNIGQQQHGLAQPQRDWKSQPLSSGQTYSWNFKEPGTYTLYDATNPSVKMTVVVE